MTKSPLRQLRPRLHPLRELGIWFANKRFAQSADERRCHSRAERTHSLEIDEWTAAHSAPCNWPATRASGASHPVHRVRRETNAGTPSATTPDQSPMSDLTKV